MREIGFAIGIEGEKPSDTIYRTRAEFLGGVFGFNLGVAIGQGIGDGITRRKSQLPRVITYNVFENENGERQYVPR